MLQYVQKVPGLRFVLGTILLTTGITVAAQGTESDQPINIESDSAELMEKDGTAIYRGNVITDQGNFHLESDTLTIYQQDNGEKIIATGAPVRFRQLPGDGDKELHGHSQEMRYFTATGQLIMIGEAWVWQEGNTMASDKIHYNTRTARAKAGQAAKGNARVHSVIKPNSRSSDPQ